MEKSLLLTDSQVIELCDEIINGIHSAQKDNDVIYLCDALRLNLTNHYNFNVDKSEISSYIPEFTFENAVKYCNARDNGLELMRSDLLDLGWWDGFKKGSIFNYQDRINFMKWIKSQYVTSKENRTLEK